MLEYFIDPILRAPTIGCILLCASSALMGSILFFQRKVLLSESVSHAAYPGAMLGVLVLSLFGSEEYIFLAVIVGALLSSWAGLKAIGFLERKIPSDSALCFTLASCFGIGVLLYSYLQQSKPVWVSQIQSFLFGQAATLTDLHILVFGFLAFLSITFVLVAYRPLQALLFDPHFAKIAGIRTKAMERALFWLLLLSIVAGIRSVGVVLISGMLIAPAIAARQFSNRFHRVLLLSALFGGLSGFFGNIVAGIYGMPTGPAIVLFGSALALFSLLFAPQRGICFRFGRLIAFRLRCLEENILKGIWKKGSLSKSEIKRAYPRSGLRLHRLLREGWVERRGDLFYLTEDGRVKAASIVRLHRLWELYLTEQLGHAAERVHERAEEMEHILTPELEERLTRLLSNPERDPHHQPIPERHEPLLRR
jgi:manganese/zinc/iron transport system permease protein